MKRKGPMPWKFCSLCGKRLPFLIDRKDYVYKIGTTYYCSYTCWMKARRERGLEK